MSMRRFYKMLNRPLQEKPVATGLQFLAVELVQEIFRYLHWPTDFYNLSLVSRTLSRLATLELYSILVIGYHRPQRISALLAHLEARPEVASLVTTLVFDEDIKCIGPKLLYPGTWPSRAHRRELVDGWDPKSPNSFTLRGYPYNRFHETISRQLNVVLHGLPNVRCVIIRRLHPFYRCLGLDPGATANGTPLINSITELFVNAPTSQMPPKVLISRLTTICISDIYYGMNKHASYAGVWNVILVDAINLQTLGMIRVEYAHIILTGRSFPHLEALELYKVFLGEPFEPDSRVLSQFLRNHSATLRTLALSTHLWWSINHCGWLSDETILPNLQTLRLDDIFALLGVVITGDTNSALDEQAEKTRVILSFIEHRPTILDVGISSLATSQADRFAEFLARTRPMRNIFIGSAVIQSLNRHTSIARRYWNYSYEAWTLYQLFGGLTICKSGFRPRLPQQTWKFWKKTFS